MGNLKEAQAIVRPEAMGIGENSRTVKSMLEESEGQLKQTGHYRAVTELSLKKKDPIHYEKLWSRLRGALVGARETALNVSASPIVREIGELCFALYTPEGDSITLSTGIMAHVHTMSEAIKHMVRADYEKDPGIAPGDIFVNNDPQLGDVHNADVMELLPIFHAGELTGWAGGVTHEIDVGAPQPASMPIGTTSRFEDGWILSCQKVGANDKLFADYERRCYTAVRLPFYWVLDEKCRIAGCQIIRDSVLRLIKEEGLETYKRFTHEVIEDTRQAFVNRVREFMIPGTYEFPSFMDVPHSIDKGRMPDYAAIDSLMHCPLEIRVGTDASFELDLEGANKWGYHSFNCTPSGLQGGLWVGITQILIPNDKVNDGAYLATKFNTPYGTWSNPDNLYASNTLSWMFLIPCFTGMFLAVSQAVAARGYVEEVVAGYPFTGNLTQGGGPNHYGQEGGWSNFEHSSCGTSAGLVRDGEACCAAVWNPEGDMGDVEAWELLEPLLYLGRRLRPSSAGMGKYRGGSGFESIRLLYNTPRQMMFNGANAHTFHGNGLFGGYPAAAPYRHSVKNTDMKQRIADGRPYPVADRDPENSLLDANVKGEHLKDNYLYHLPDMHKEYDLYVSMICGGHGVGDVLERDPAMVIKDLDDDLVLERFASSAYGVVAKKGADGRYVLDAKATELRRAEIRRQRLARSVPVQEWIAKEQPRVKKGEYIEAVREMYRQSMQLSSNWAGKYRRFWSLPADWTI
jgi:N-methylhydantoinase B/oxoprolinase/acetone carboxylase alpha subunit